MDKRLMGGFEAPRALYKLDFAGTELDGLEVHARSAPVGTLIGMAGLSAVAGDFEAAMAAAGDGDAAAVPRLQEQLRAVFRPFADVLESWNLTDRGQPVPATLDGLLSQDLPLVQRVIEAYAAALTRAPPPLPGGSPSGASSREVPPAAVSGSVSRRS